MKVLLLDNYDSFTYNLVHLIESVNDEFTVDVFKNDKILLSDVDAYQKIVLSPGPGLPKDAGIMPDVIKTYCKTKSILGVCLGMQAIAEIFGAKLKNLETVFHGIATPINANTQTKLFKHCPSDFLVARYHSWVVDNTNLPNELEITASDKEKNIMALQHIKYNVCGVQFHPESILCEHGEQIISNWLKL